MKLHEPEHPYYCSESNFYAVNVAERYENVSDFLEGWMDQDIDRNLCFRWDVHQCDDKTYYAEIFIIQQRKGIFKPIVITSYIPDRDEPLIRPYLEKHWAVLQSLWRPISDPEKSKTS